jgi:signal transduction histidine kinase
MIDELEEGQSSIRPSSQERCRDESERECLIYLLLSALFQPNGPELSSRSVLERGGDLSLLVGPKMVLQRHKGNGGNGSAQANKNHDKDLERRQVAGRSLDRRVLLERLASKERGLAYPSNIRVESNGDGNNDLESVLRNLLHVIKGAAYYLETTEHVQAGIRRDFSKLIAQETDRLASLLESLLTGREQG